MKVIYQVKQNSCAVKRRKKKPEEEKGKKNLRKKKETGEQVKHTIVKWAPCLMHQDLVRGSSRKKGKKR